MTKEIKMAKITFDYSKASGFVADHEMEYMKKIANDAKDVLVSKRVPEMTFRLD